MEICRPINLYVLLQTEEDRLVPVCDQILSGKRKAVMWRRAEIRSMRSLVRTLTQHGATIEDLDSFYYSYTILQIGKEFDLLKVTDHMVLNLELKSVNMGSEEIRSQLLRNRYYLRTLDRTMKLYTYVASEKQFYKLDDKDALIGCDGAEVLQTLQSITGSTQCNLETLFDPSHFLVSPMEDPKRFLDRQYFLTQHQEQIERSVLEAAEHYEKSDKKEVCYFNITGAAGTGKTLLLFDIARELLRFGRVAILRCTEEFDRKTPLDGYWDTLDFLALDALRVKCDLSEYVAICLDEAHRLSAQQLGILLAAIKKHPLLCIFSSDASQIFTKAEQKEGISRKLHMLPGVQNFQLTMKLRMNPELSSFLMRLRCPDTVVPEKHFSNVLLLYARNTKEAEKIIDHYEREGYVYLRDLTKGISASPKKEEYGSILVTLDQRFYYNEKGVLTAKQLPDFSILYDKMLYYAITRAKKRLAVLVIANSPLFSRIANIFQNEESHK